jgi:hypothetical protein
MNDYQSPFPEDAKTGIYLCELADGSVDADTTGDNEAIARMLIECYVKFSTNMLVVGVQQAVRREIQQAMREIQQAVRREIQQAMGDKQGGGKIITP